MSNRPTEFLDPVPEHPHIRAPFPWSPMLIIVIGILIFLLFLSAGFNIWVLANPEHPMRQVERARVQEDLLRQQQIMTQQAEERIRQMQQDFQQKLGALQRKNDDLTAQLEAAKQPMDEAKCDNCAEPQEQKWGTLEGRFIYANVPPPAKPFPANVNAAVGPLLAQAQKKGLRNDGWRIDPKNDGVADVIVFLKRSAHGKLPIHADDKVRKDATTLDAPLCVFEPRVLVYYPMWFDGEERGQTGQSLSFKNSSPVGQNRRIQGNPKFNEGFNRNLPAKSEFAVSELNERQRLRPQPSPMLAQCDVHPWMQAWLMVVDNPYFALTKSDGSFTIPRVPAGIEVQVMAWHESKGWLFTKDGKTVTLKAGKNTLDELDLSAK